MLILVNCKLLLILLYLLLSVVIILTIYLCVFSSKLEKPCYYFSEFSSISTLLLVSIVLYLLQVPQHLLNLLLKHLLSNPQLQMVSLYLIFLNVADRIFCLKRGLLFHLNYFECFFFYLNNNFFVISSLSFQSNLPMRNHILFIWKTTTLQFLVCAKWLLREVLKLFAWIIIRLLIFLKINPLILMILSTRETHCLYIQLSQISRV